VPEDEEMAKNKDVEEAANKDNEKEERSAENPNDESTITTNSDTGEERSAEINDMSNIENEEERSEDVLMGNDLMQHIEGSENHRNRIKYRLRKQINSIKDQRFNKEHYNYLQYENEVAAGGLFTPMNKEQYMQVVSVLGQRLQEGKVIDKVMLQKCMVGHCFAQQMSAAKGIRMYGERAMEAMAKEYAQLDNLAVFIPRMWNSLTKEERISALSVIDLVQEKRSGKIKGRTVVDGRGQQGSYEKVQISSYALTIDGFFCTLVIDAKEDRDVGVSDIAGAFLKAKQRDYVIIKMRGPAVEASLRVNYEKYSPFVVIEKGGTKVIYMQLLKAMYGTLTAALFWYELFAGTLKEEGFFINPYD